MSTPGDVKDEFPYQIDEFYLDLQNDGASIAILDEAEITKKPFPGLRPFRTSEFQLFKGRGGQAEELINRLKKNNILAVIGSSGTGKSSLVRAGLIPQLLGGYLHAAGTRWNIAICRPGKNPIENLSIALSSVKSKSKDRGKIFDDYKLIEPLLDNSVYGVLNVNEILNSDEDKQGKKNLLIIIDQFEELFRFQRDDLSRQNIENHFVNLLLKAALTPGSAIYVIITMRSEFLGDCVKFRGLPEAINEGQYLVPQLSRTQLKEAIEGPIRLAGKKIDPGLVELLINEIDENKLKENLDQLPILQHVLMRSYNQAMKEGDDTEISYEHYESVGSMKNALAYHAETLFETLEDENTIAGKLSKKQEIAKIIFQALTDMSADHKGGRRPIELANIYAVAASLNASNKEVDEVIDHFRENEASFIMPPINTALHPGLILDISHESLMRNWVRLNDWMNEEVQNGRLYKTLNERRLLNEKSGGNDELIRGGLLVEMLNWEKQRHNSAWASRYHSKPDLLKNNETDEEVYKKNLEFLQKSNEESIRIRHLEKINLETKIRLAKKNRIIITSILIVALLISSALGIFAWRKGNVAVEARKKADSLAREAKINSEIADEEKNEADRLTFETNLKLSQWWKDPYLTDNIKKQINDRLVYWYFTNPSLRNSLLAEKMDYSLRIIHEAENRKNKDYNAYLQLIVYARKYDKNIATNIGNSNIVSANKGYNNNTTLLNVNNKIGTDYYNERNYSGAILAFNENLKIDANSSSTWDMLGRTYYAMNKYDTAIIKYQKAMALAPNNHVYIEDLGKAYIAHKDYQHADFVLSKVTNDADALNWSGRSLYAQNKFPEAIKILNKAIQIDSNFLENYGWLARTYNKLDSPKLVKKYLDILKGIKTEDYGNFFVLARFYTDNDDFPNGVKYYKEYIKFNKTFWLAYNNLAGDYCRLGKYNEVIAYADSAIYLCGTQIMLSQSQVQLAEAQLLRNPANPYAHKGYADLLIQTATKTKDDKNLIKARFNFEKALSFDPTFQKTCFYYACYYALMNEKEESIKSLKKAISTGFNDQKWIASEPMLSSIRNEPGYKKLMIQLNKKPVN